jgi:hypothetical protein
MIAHVNKEQIVLVFVPRDNLLHDEWELLLDELKSHHIPNLYPPGKRSHVDLEWEESSVKSHRVLIYLTTKTVTMDEAIAILKRRNIEIAPQSD